MTTRFLARMSSHQHSRPPIHGHALLGMRSTGPRYVSHLPVVCAPMHGVSSRSSHAYVLKSPTGNVQFIAVCSSSIRAETLGYAVSFSSPPGSTGSYRGARAGRESEVRAHEPCVT